MTTPACIDAMTESDKLSMGLALSWIGVREYRSVNGTPESIKQWDDLCLSAVEAAKAGDVNVAKFGVEQNVSADEKRFLATVLYKMPNKCGDVNNCKIYWSLYACYINWASKISIDKLEVMSPKDMEAFVCDAAVRDNPLYSGDYPAPGIGQGTVYAGPMEPASTTKWVVGISVAAVLSAGIIYAITREKKQADQRAVNPQMSKAQLRSHKGETFSVFTRSPITGKANKIGGLYASIKDMHELLLPPDPEDSGDYTQVAVHSSQNSWNTGWTWFTRGSDGVWKQEDRMGRPSWIGEG